MLHMIVPNRVRVVAGEKLRPGGMALGGVVKLSKPQSIFCQPVNVWGFDFATIATKVRVAHVIHHNKDKVGTGVVRF